MLNMLYVLLIGAMGGSVLTLALCELFYRKKLQDTEDHWSITFHSTIAEWAEFYKAEVKRWQSQTTILVNRAANEAAQATNDLWRGKKADKPKPSN
jgi:hypothetical protein